MAEWSIAAVLKTVELRGSGGSNPSLSATNAENQQIAKQTPSFTPKNAKSGVFVLFKIMQTNVCNLFYFRGGQICPERFEDKSWSYGWQAKIRSSQGRLRSDGGKDGRHAVTRSPARSAEEWKRGEMLYGSTAFLCLQRGKVVRMDCGDREWLIRFLFRDICNLRPDRGKWRAKFLPHSSPSSNGTQKGFKGVYISFKNYLLNLQMIRHE